MANYDEPQRLSDHELFLQSIDQSNYPYISMRGMLYWTGTAWAKWTGALSGDVGITSGTGYGPADTITWGTNTAAGDDSRYTGLVVKGSSYGSYPVANGGIANLDTMRPLLFDQDDDSLLDSQVMQKVLGLNYGYDGSNWERLATDGSGSLKVNITGGFSAGTEYTDGDTDATPTGSVAMGTDGSEIYALLTDADGHLQVDVLSGGGGGTQYTEGDVDATITGTAILWEDAGNTLVAVSATKPLPVDITDASVAVTGTFWQATQPVSGTFWQATQPVSGTVTANQGAAGAAAWLVNGSGVTQPVSIAADVGVTANNLDIRDIDKDQDDITVYQTYHDNLNANANLQINNTDVAVDNAVPVKSGTGATFAVTQSGVWNVTVTATDLDIRDLTATDVVTAEIKPLASCGNGVNTVASAGTAEALGSSTAIDSVTIKALSTNTGMIYVGDSGVDSTNGFQLSAGDSVSLDVDNLTDVYIDSAENGEGVSFIYIT